MSNVLEDCSSLGLLLYCLIMLAPLLLPVLVSLSPLQVELTELVRACGFLESGSYLAALESATNSKLYGHTILQVFVRAIPCNMFVNMGIMMGIAGEDVISKIVGIWIPIAAFASVGMEHVIANIYYVHVGLFHGFGDYGRWMYASFLPSLAGNIIGGVLMGVVYYICMLSQEDTWWRFGACALEEETPDEEMEMETPKSKSKPKKSK